MKNINLPYKFDLFDLCIGYDYEKHLWVYDAKFYLVANKWCTDEKGKNSVSDELTKNQKEELDKYKPIVEKREKFNQSYLQHINCRKRTCICKKCQKFCYCYECNEKKIKCDKRIN